MPEHTSRPRLTVSDLADRSGLPVSTVRYYVREGLIPAGRRLSRTRILYDGEHLKALETIKSLRGAGVPLTEIRSRATHVTDSPSDAAIAQARRNDVLEAATSCFLRAGFAGTSLGAIARGASMSKATLYRYFSSKEEIFMACAERVFHQLYTDVWPAITQTRKPGERLRPLARLRGVVCRLGSHDGSGAGHGHREPRVPRRIPPPDQHDRRADRP
jgi:DNA-binding transcriptional MerR regulator